jgi:hypothetical protein
VHATLDLWSHKKGSCTERWHMREIRGGNCRGEIGATSFEMVWTYLMAASGGTGS